MSGHEVKNEEKVVTSMGIEVKWVLFNLFRYLFLGNEFTWYQKKKTEGKKRLKMKAKERSCIRGGKLSLDLGKKLVLIKRCISFWVEGITVDGDTNFLRRKG